MSALSKKTKENGRDRLIASALKLFSEKSFHGVSVREICDDAHANPSLISFHFGGKESLLEVIFEEELLSPKFKEMEKILSTAESNVDFQVKLGLFLESYVGFYLDHRDVVSLYFEELERGHEMARKILPQTFGGMWDRLIAFIKEAQEKGFVDKELDESILCYQVMSPFICLIRARCTNIRRLDSTLEDEEFKKKLINQVVCSLKE